MSADFFRPIGWQDVRLRTGEGKLRPEDVLAAVNAELASRVALFAQAGPPSAWRPISEAPRDGTLLDLWCEWGGSGYRATNCFWGPEFADADEQGWRREYAESPGSSFEPHGKPTHWQPLPAPPEEPQ